MIAPVITFLSDYGLEDEFVGVCHGVIAGIAPRARVIDLSHGVPRHDVVAGALLLRGALPYMPAGVHLAVVDPDVGAARRAVALRTASDPERLLVGPDNGLLMPAAEVFGGVVEAIDIGHSPARLQPVSATFHGRDLFAPVAARLAAGARLAELGEPCDVDRLVGLELSAAAVGPGRIVARAVRVDRFGNVALNVSHAELDGAGLRLGRTAWIAVGGAGDDGAGAQQARLVRTFADVAPGDLLIYEDAQRVLAIAVAHGSAQARLRIATGDEVVITAADPGAP